LLADSRGEQFLVQLAGIVAAGVWTFGVTYGVFRVVNVFIPLRVSEAEEEIGLDMAEHGTVNEMLELWGSRTAPVGAGD
jgi:Amt family ammonium transporter